MKTYHTPFESFLYASAILSAGFILFNFAALPLFRTQIFMQQQTVSAVEYVLLAGFLAVVLFNIASLAWLAGRLKRGWRYSGGVIMMALPIMLATVVIFAEKVMVDEIGREMRLGWEITGEWIILYTLLALQFLYSSYIGYAVKRGR